MEKQRNQNFDLFKNDFFFQPSRIIFFLLIEKLVISQEGIQKKKWFKMFFIWLRKFRWMKIGSFNIGCN